MIERQYSRPASIRHGQSRLRGKDNGTPTYISWLSMISRCYYEKHDSFKYYGARGIKVCDSWREDFRSFLLDVGERPEGKTLGRINNDGNYEPSNCEWQTKEAQARNRTNNRLIFYDGRTQTLEGWSKETGIFRGTIWARLEAEWPVDKALTIPVRKMKNNWKQNVV